MRFGIFDHMDEAGPPLAQQFEQRLTLLETSDRLDFYAYHLAEHHGTPLGLAPSPGIFLAGASNARRGAGSLRWVGRGSAGMRGMFARQRDYAEARGFIAPPGYRRHRQEATLLYALVK